MDRLLARQAYVLAFWQTPNQGINYRRFFTISELVGIRIGDPVTFEAIHAVPLRLADKGLVTGFRIDHIDGLRDPQGYLDRLQERLRGTATDPEQLPFYVVLEKILSSGERLPRQWPVQGTTGYDFLNAVNGLFVDEQSVAPLEKSYREFVHSEITYEDLVYLKKKQVMASILSVEMRSLGYYLGLIALQDRYGRDMPREQLVRALVEITACLPVYRTYLRSFEVPAADRKFIEFALSEALRRNPSLEPAALTWLRELLLLDPAEYVLPEQREQRLAFVMMWQQLTGSITAKGVEDSALYVYNRLVSVNEVGGTPTSPADSPLQLHDFLEQRQKGWPCSMNATMTHDVKHAEDFRARVNVLSEIPQEWSTAVSRWSEWNANLRTQVGQRFVPEPNEEMLIYQALLGSWPTCDKIGDVYVQRIQDFVVKAGREAMVHTRWAIPNVEHEKALTDFVASILTTSPSNPFLAEFDEFATRIAFHGALNSLAQLLIKIGSPGVSDFYQGSELWDLRLVDPDNRSPVDFKLRAKYLADVSQGAVRLPDVLSNWRCGVLKMFVAQRPLRFRREQSQLFLKGKYLPVSARGTHQESVFAFARRLRSTWALIVVPRFTTRLSTAPTMPLGKDTWCDTALLLPQGAPREWTNLLAQAQCGCTNESEVPTLALSEIFREVPVALLTANPGKKD